METYNGKTLEEIANNFPSNMPQIHRDMYLNNCKEVIKNEAAEMNTGYCEAIKNTNFELIKHYLYEANKRT